MTVLVVGANGQLGQSLQVQLSREKINFLALTKNEIDITQPRMIEQCLKKFSPIVVVNLAAYTAVDLAETSIDLAYEINAIGCKNLAICCSMFKLPLIHISTDYVFDGDSQIPYKPTDSPNPINIYGASKLKGEKLIQQYSEKYIILRTSGVYGEFGNNFLKTMLNLSQTTKELNIISDQFTTPTYSGDLAFAILKICLAHQSQPLENNIYHYGGPKTLSWFDFAKEIFLYMSTFQPKLNSPVLAPVLSKNYITPAQRPIFSALDSSSLNDKYDLPCIDISDRISSTIDKLIATGFIS